MKRTRYSERVDVFSSPPDWVKVFRFRAALTEERSCEEELVNRGADCIRVEAGPKRRRRWRR
jgi:hypothetical protein